MPKKRKYTPVSSDLTTTSRVVLGPTGLEVKPDCAEIEAFDLRDLVADIEHISTWPDDTLGRKRMSRRPTNSSSAALSWTTPVK